MVVLCNSLRTIQCQAKLLGVHPGSLHATLQRTVVEAGHSFPVDSTHCASNGALEPAKAVGGGTADSLLTECIGNVAHRAAAQQQQQQALFGYVIVHDTCADVRVIAGPMLQRHRLLQGS
jgi:hypothetical protein